MIRIVLFFLILICMGTSAVSNASDVQILFREDFNNLENWEPLYFKKIKEHTAYIVSTDNNGENYLRAESEASASALVYESEFNVYEYPEVRWRWKIENVYAQSDPKTKDGDDYPIRVYIIFKYNPDKAGFFEKLKYSTAKKLYGKYPPKSSLNYVWSSKEIDVTIFPNPYTDKSMMVILEHGASRVGYWVDEEVNIIRDYELAFGEKPPEHASIAIMNDSDNTGEKSVSYIDFIEVYREKKTE